MSQKPLLSQADDLLIAIDRYWESSNQPKTYPDTNLAQQYFNQAQNLISQISSSPSADPLTNLLEKEASRVLANCQQELADSQQQKQPDFETALSILGIQESELGFIEEWLSENLSKVKEANTRLINEFSQDSLMYVPLGITKLREEAESMVSEAIKTFQTIVKTTWSSLPGVQELYNLNYIFAPNTRDDRSFHDKKSRIISIGVKNNTRIFKGKTYLIPGKLLGTLSHEFLGHARNFSLSLSSTILPQYMTVASTRFLALRPNLESVAWYFEDQVFEYLKKDPEIYNKFNFAEPLEQVIQKYNDTALMTQYIDHLGWLGICAIGKTGRDDKVKQHEIITKYCIDPKTASDIIDYYHRNNAFDTYSGHLKSYYIRELIYAFQHVHKFMASVPEDQKSAVEKTVLTGYWTRQGISDWLKFSHPDLKF